MSALMAEQEQNEGIQLAVPGLGDRLRAARMACNLDLAKLAARIHLTTDMVEALERDDYAEMPARVFVRGYVRNYARAVNLPSESVLAQFDRLWPDEQNRVKVQESPGLATDVPARRLWPRLVTWLVLLATIGLPLIWWQGYLDQYLKGWKDSSAPSTELSAETPPVQATSPASRPITSGAGLTPLPPAKSEVANAPAEASLPTATAPMAAETSSDTAALIESDSTTGATEPSPPAASVSESPADAAATLLPLPAPKTEAPTSSVASAAQEPAAVAEPVADAPPRITLRFRRNSWVDIRDSTRSFKLVGIMKEGTQKTLGGKPPYNVVLGNANAVELQIDGKPYDLKPHIRGNVARFTLTP